MVGTYISCENNVEMSVSLSPTQVGIGTLTNAQGLHFGKILLKYVYVIK